MNRNRNILLEYFQLQRSNIDHYLRMCVAGTEAESVHRLRVSIKKIRTVYKLAGILLPSGTKGHKKELTRLRHLFKLAGAIRDAQVAGKLVSGYETRSKNTYIEFKTYIREKEERSISRFFIGLETLQNELKSLPASRNLENSLKVLPYSDIASYLLKLLEKRYSKIKKIILNRPDVEGLHTIRMLLKQMRYLIAIARSKDPRFEALDLSLTGLKTTEALLGQWHDCIMLEEFLQEYLKTQSLPDKTSEKNYKTLGRSIEKERIKLTEQVSRSLSEQFGTIPT